MPKFHFACGVTDTGRDSRHEREQERDQCPELVVGGGRRRWLWKTKDTRYLARSGNIHRNMCSSLPGMKTFHLCPMTIF